MATTAVDPSSVALPSTIANMTAKDLTAVLQGDPALTPMVSWMLQGADTNQFMSTAEGAALSALIKDPAAAQAANLGIQALNGVDVTKSLESMAAQQIIGNLGLNQDQTNIANLGLMTAMGASPVGWAMEGLSLGQQYLPELFGGGSGPIINAQQNAPQTWTLDGGVQATRYNQGNRFVNGAFQQVPAVWKVGDKVYPSYAALQYDLTQKNLVSQGYAAPVAQLMALDKVKGYSGDSGSIITPDKYASIVADMTSKVDAQLSKMGNPSIVRTDSLTNKLQDIMALSDPSVTNSPVSSAIQNIQQQLQRANLLDPAQRTQVTDYLKSQFGSAVPQSITTALKTDYANQQNTYRDQVRSSSPEIGAIIDKYTAPGAKPPALGSMDAVVMAKYLGMPAKAVTDLTNMAVKANGGKPFAAGSSQQNILGSIGKIAEPTGTFSSSPSSGSGYTGPISATSPEFIASLASQQAYWDQRDAGQQASLKTLEDQFTALKAQYPDGTFDGMNYMQWQQLSPTAQKQFLDEKAAKQNPTADQLAAKALQDKVDAAIAGPLSTFQLPYPAPQNDAERQANYEASYAFSQAHSAEVNAIVNAAKAPADPAPAPSAPAPAANPPQPQTAASTAPDLSKDPNAWVNIQNGLSADSPEFKAAQAAQAKYYADKQAKFLADYAAAHPEEEAARAQYAKMMADQEANAATQAARAASPLPMSDAVSNQQTAAQVAAETAAYKAADAQRIQALKDEKSTWDAQQTAAQQAKVSAIDKALADALATVPQGSLGNMTSTQWAQMTPAAQQSTLAYAQTFPQRQQAMADQTAANKATDAAMPFPNPTTDAERAANIQAYYTMNNQPMPQNAIASAQGFGLNNTAPASPSAAPIQYDASGSRIGVDAADQAAIDFRKQWYAQQAAATTNNPTATNPTPMVNAPK